MARSSWFDRPSSKISATFVYFDRGSAMMMPLYVVCHYLNEHAFSGSFLKAQDAQRKPGKRRRTSEKWQIFHR
jgi:hypothetical protein